MLLAPVSSYRYKPRYNDEGLYARLATLVREKPRLGYRHSHVLLESDISSLSHHPEERHVSLYSLTSLHWDLARSP